MEIKLDITEEVEKKITSAVMRALENSNIQQLEQQNWVDLKAGAKYAGVSDNTFKKFRQQGLKVFKIDSVLRVSKAEIDRFLQENSF